MQRAKLLSWQDFFCLFLANILADSIIVRGIVKITTTEQL